MLRERKDAAQRLKDIKRNIEESYQYFYDNYVRYKKFMKFVYCSALTPDDLAKLKALKKPAIEFGILEAYINRRIGEFAQHEPSVQVRAADGLSKDEIDENLIKTIEVVEGHCREIIDSVTNDGFRTQLYKDTMGGGFSVAEVYTEYLNEMSFEQCIRIERVFDPTLCGFDPLAKESHKGDGQYCFKVFPMTKEEFEEQYGKESTAGMVFQRDVSVESFNWSYVNQEKKILLVVDFFCKERRKKKIAKLSNGKSIIAEHYDQLVEIWKNQGRIEQPPIILQERQTFIEEIWHYRICENKIISETKTDYKYLPLVFFDGNSANIERSQNGPCYQMTKPYVYQAEGVQRLKNFAGQSMASEIETLVQHKFVVSMEAIPTDYIDAYTNPQQAQVLAYNAFYDKNPDMPLAPPQVIQRTDTPQIVQAAFEGTDRTTMAILGSFDAQQGQVGDRLSGRAIELGAMQSDAASLPYLENFIKGMNWIGQILLDLIPKYYLTPRSIPIRLPNGLRDYVVVNDKSDPNSIFLKYDPKNLQIKIEAGVNSSMQKKYAIDQITRLMEASELFAQFMNSEGLDIFIENIDIKGIEELKQRAAVFMKNMKEAQAQNAGKPDPMEELVQAEKLKVEGGLRVEAEKINQKRQEAEFKQSNEMARIAIEEQKAETELMKVIAELDERYKQLALAEDDKAGKVAKEAIQLAMDVAKHHHEVNMAEREQMMNEQQMQSQGQEQASA